MEYDPILRKCRYCEESIRLDGDISYAFTGKFYVHEKCYLANAKDHDGTPFADLAETCASFIQDVIAKERIEQIIAKEYGMVRIPNALHDRLNAIYSGTYSGMSMGIPPAHLWDLWDRKLGELRVLRQRKIRQGNAPAGLLRIYYDIGCLINMYGDYLDERRIAAVERQLRRERAEAMRQGPPHAMFRGMQFFQERSEHGVEDLLQEIT